MSFLKRLVDPAGVTRGRGVKAFTDPANLQGRGARGALDPAGLTGGRRPRDPGNTSNVPAYMRGTKGSVGPPIPKPQGAPGGRGGAFGGMARPMAQAMAQAIQQRRPVAPSAAPTAGAAPVAGSAPGMRIYSDGGKVFDRKPNGKKC